MNADQQKPVSLAGDFESYAIDNDYEIVVERGPHFCIEFPMDTGTPGAGFTHPNIVRTVSRLLEYKRYRPDYSAPQKLEQFGRVV